MYIFFYLIFLFFKNFSSEINAKVLGFINPPLFKVLDILPIDLQINYASISFMHDFTQSKLTCSFYQTWMKNNVVNEHYNLRYGDDYFIGRHRYNFLTTHQLFNFPSLWNDLDKNLKALKSNLLDSL